MIGIQNYKALLKFNNKNNVITIYIYMTIVFI